MITIVRQTIQAVLFLIVPLSLFMEPSLSLARPKYKEFQVTNGGKIIGTVKFSEKRIASKKVKIRKDHEHCGEYITLETLVVSPDGGVANAVISLKGIKAGKKWDLPVEAVFNQRKCAFIPHVMVVRPRTAVVVKNDDEIKHNFHTISRGVFNINKMMSPGTTINVAKRKIKKPGTVKVKCDLHDWMSAWWVVAENPYTVVSDEKGEFTLNDVPPGVYDLSVWHEKLGKTITKVKVEPGATTRIVISVPVKK